MLRGRVVHGDSVGKINGHPTANFGLSPARISLSSGVYAALALMNRKKFKAALVIGVDPGKVEVHFLDYQGQDFYGEQIEVEPIQKVSEIEKFETEKERREKHDDDTSGDLYRW